MPTVAELGIEVDATDKGAEALLARIDAAVEKVDGKDVTVDVTAQDVAQVGSELEQVGAVLDELDGQNANLDVLLGGADQALFEFDELTGAVTALDGQEASIPVDVPGVQEAITGLDALIAEAQAADAQEIDIPAGATIEELAAQLAEAEAMVNHVDNLKATVETAAEIEDLLAQLSLAESAIRAVDDQNIEIEADLDVAALLTKLAILRAALRDLKVDIDANGSAFDNARRRGEGMLQRLATISQRTSTNISGVTAAVLALGPALVPIGAVALAGLGSIAGMAVAAGVGTAAFGAVAVGALLPIKDTLEKVSTLQDQYNLAITDKQKETALKKLAVLYESLDAPQRKLLVSIGAFQTHWDLLVQRFQPEVFAIATRNLDTMNYIMGNSEPLLAEMANAFLFLSRRMQEALQGEFWTEFGNNLTDVAGPITVDLLTAFGNIIEGIAGIVNAFLPMSVDFSEGFVGMTEDFKNWGTALDENPGFQNFVGYVYENTPKVLSLIAALWQGILAIIEAAAPIGEFVVDAFTRFGDAISRLNEEHPQLLTLGLAILGISAIIANLIGPISNLIQLAAQLSSAWGVIASAFEGVTLGAFASFIGTAAAVIAAVVAIVGGLILAYQHITEFRESVDELVQKLRDMASSILEAVSPAIDVVVGFFNDMVQKVKDWADEHKATFDEAWEYIVENVGFFLSGLVNSITGALNIITYIWSAMWPGLLTILQGVWDIISGVISGALDIILGIITIFAGIFAGDWGAVWDGALQIVSGVWTAIWGVIKGAGQIIAGILQAMGGLIWSIMEDAFGGLIDIVRPAIEGIYNAALWLYDVMVGNSVIPDLVNAIIDWFGRLGSFLMAFMGPIVNALVAAWQLILSVVTTVATAIWNVVTTYFNLVTSVIQTAMALVLAIWNRDWATVRQILSTVMAAIQAAVQAGMALVRSAISTALAFIKSIWLTIWNALPAPVREILSTIRAAVVQWGSDVVSTVTGLGSRLLAAGESIMRSLASGIRNGIGWATDAISSAVSAVTSFLPGSPAERGPLSGSGYVLLRAQRFMGDLTSGLKDTAALQNAASNVASILDIGPTGTSNASALASAYGNAIAGEGRGITTVTLTIEEGAVQVDASGATDPDAVGTAVSAANADLAEQIRLALGKRD